MKSVAIFLFGVVVSGAAAFAALQSGELLAVLLALGFALTLFFVGRNLRLVAEGYPNEVAVDALLQRPHLEATEDPGAEVDEGQDAGPRSVADNGG